MLGCRNGNMRTLMRVCMVAAAIGCRQQHVKPVAPVAAPVSTETPPPAVPKEPASAIYEDTAAGRIYGSVVGNASGIDVPLASAIVTDRKTGSAASDSLGRFQLALPPGRVAITTRRLGFRQRIDTFDIVADRGLHVRLPLSMETLQLDEVCACDPERLVEFEIDAPPSIRTAGFVYIQGKARGIDVIRDSIAAEELAHGHDTRNLWFAYGSPIGVKPSERVVDVEVFARGFKPWRKRRVPIGTTVHVKLVPR